MQKQRKQLTQKQSKQAVPKRSSRAGNVSKSHPITKVYKLLTPEENKTRHERYISRLNELKLISNIMNESTWQVEKIDKLQTILVQWKKYANCDKIPEHYPTNLIRSFYFEDRFRENECVFESMRRNWPHYDCNILSQNISRRQKANNLQKNILAPHYDKSIDEKLKVLRNIDKFLDDDSETAKVTAEQLRNIADVRVLTEQEICDVFDRFTYRIISAENIYMKSLDPITSEFCYSCANFDIHIWSLKNVPIRFAHMQEPRLIANLHKIDLKLHIPFSALSPLMTIQGIRMNFDNISKHAKSFKQETYLPLETLNAGIYDLRECLLNEYKMILDIQRRVRNEIEEKYQKYKEDLLRYMESRLHTQRGLKANKVIRPFRSKEPQTCADDQYPDVMNDFLEEEHNQYLGFINVMYNPRALDLESDEINLKKFHILGGIYQLNLVKKPKQINFFQKSNMIWHCEGQNLVVENDFRVHKLSSTVIPEALARFTRLERMSNTSVIKLGQSRRSTHMEDEPVETEEVEASNPWFVLTFYLPDYLCCWGSPMACHYESVDEDLPVEKKENSRENMVKSLIKLSDDENEAPIELSPEERQIMELQDILRKRMRLSRSLYASAPSMTRLYNMISFSMANGQTALQAIRDFKLNSFTLSQFHNLQRFCVPLLLPSYQFPKEKKEEVFRAQKKRASVRSSQPTNSLENDNNLNHSYIFDPNLKNPERLFAIYGEAEPVFIVKSLHDIDYGASAHSEPKTFYQLIKALMAMKKVIQNHVSNLMSVTPHKTESNIQRIKATIQKRMLTFEPKSKETTSPVVKPLTLKKSGSMRALSAKQTSKVNLINATADDSSSDLSSIATNATGMSTISKDAKETNVIPYTHWTTKYIKTERFFKAERKYVIETDRLGYIGFAFKRYEHFPFKYWNLQPNEADPNNEVVLTIITQHVKCVLQVSGQGVRGYVTDYMHGQQYLANPKMYLFIDKPIKDYTELKRLFKEKNLNIFPDIDASFYVENGYFSEKHLAMELHTYSCMAVHCTEMKFTHCQWNCLAKRRDIILQAVQWKDNPDNTVLMHVTPEETTFVEVKEMCTEEREEVKLSYTSTWRNINMSYDLSQAICSMYPYAMDLRCRNVHLISCLKSLLTEIRPLSFS